MNNEVNVKITIPDVIKEQRTITHSIIDIEFFCKDLMENTEDEDRLLKIECLQGHMAGIRAAITSSIKLLGELNEDE